MKDERYIDIDEDLLLENLRDPDIELSEEDETLINSNPADSLKVIKKELWKNKLYLDKKIYEVELLTKSYEKFSQSVFMTKLELAKEKRSVLEALAKIVLEESKLTKEEQNIESIADVLNKAI